MVGDRIWQRDHFDPADNPKNKTGMYASVLRNKCNQGMRNGIIVKEYTGHDPQLEAKLEQIGSAWHNARKGPQIHYVHIHLIFANRSNKRWFYAEQNGALLGVLMLNRIDAYQGWVQNLCMITPEAPKYTSEVMILSVLDVLRAEGCRFLSAGHMPALQLGRIEGFGILSQWLARKVYTIAQKIFKLCERQRFWKKFDPRTEPTFLAFSKSRIGIAEIKGIMHAFNAKIINKPAPR